MFNNPLRKYASGGAAPSQDQQKMLMAFVEWLPKRVKEFANMQPEQIVEALNGMSKTPEGQKQVEQLMQQFQQEMSGTQAGQFKKGGKLWNFICKHATGGQIAGCGCENKVTKGEMGLQRIGDHSPRPANINIPIIPGLIAELKQRKAADSGNATDRNFSKINWKGNQYFLERANIGGNTTDTWIQVTPRLDTLVEQILPSGRVTPLTSEQAQSIIDRNRTDINRKEDGGIIKAALGSNNVGEKIRSFWRSPLKSADAKRNPGTYTEIAYDENGLPEAGRMINPTSGDTMILKKFTKPELLEQGFPVVNNRMEELKQLEMQRNPELIAQQENGGIVKGQFGEKVRLSDPIQAPVAGTVAPKRYIKPDLLSKSNRWYTNISNDMQIPQDRNAKELWSNDGTLQSISNSGDTIYVKKVPSLGMVAVRSNNGNPIGHAYTDKDSYEIGNIEEVLDALKNNMKNIKYFE